jgi:hypothetical protein
MSKTVVQRGRYQIKRVYLNRSLTAFAESDFISQIRATPDYTSELLMTWTVSFDNGTDGADGILRLEADDTVTGAVTKDGGFMDVMRVDGGQKTSEFDEAIEVEFRGMPSDE